MRKFISGLLIVTIISTVSIGFSASSIKQAYYNNDIKIRINGKYINTTPILYTGKRRVIFYNYECHS